MTIKAVAYLRISGKGQIKGDGFRRQDAAIQKYAKAHKIDVVGTYKDAGVSGTKELEDREGLSELILRIRSNGVRIVLVEKADRLARDIIASEIILREFRGLGVKVIAVEKTGIDLTEGDKDNPTAKLIRHVLGAVAEFEKDVLVLKLRASRKRIRNKTGKCEGRKAFGEKDSEKETLALIRKLGRKPRNGQRLSYAKIAAKLNADGVPTRMGGKWNPRSVYGILNKK